MRNPYMKFQNSSIHGFKVMLCIKKRDERTDGRTDGRTEGRTDGRTNNPEAICPSNFFEVGGIIIAAILLQVLHSMNHAIMLLCPLQCSPNYWSNIAISTAIYESCSNAWRNIGSSIALYMNHAVMLLCALQCSPNHWSNTATSTAHYESCRNAAMCIAMFPQLLKQYCYKYYTL